MSTITCCALIQLLFLCPGFAPAARSVALSIDDQVLQNLATGNFTNAARVVQQSVANDMTAGTYSRSPRSGTDVLL